MQFSPNYVRYLAVFFALSLMIEAVMLSSPVPPQSVLSSEQQWQLPKLEDRSLFGEMAKKASVSIVWGLETSVAADAKTESDWSLKGIVRSGGQNFALINVESKTARYMKGSKLPGAVIESIESTGIWIIQKKNLQAPVFIKVHP